MGSARWWPEGYQKGLADAGARWFTEGYQKGVADAVQWNCGEAIQ